VTEPDFQLDRLQMVRQQLEPRGIHDARVLAAMSTVPRHRFVPVSSHGDAYADRALPIDCEQTISQPFIVALMTQALRLSGNERVLEIGTGSGYQTAVLAELAREVVSVERHAELSRRAAEVLAELGYNNVTLLCGDGTLGCPDRAPYDRIMVTAASRDVPPALFEQLAEGGILVIPLGERDYQNLQAIEKRGGRQFGVDLSPCRFVPLVGDQGWPEEHPPA
jgi:protein-L-isoaspartate(D-aspartate) O-methyltransferase